MCNSGKKMIRSANFPAERISWLLFPDPSHENEINRQRHTVFHRGAVCLIRFIASICRAAVTA